MLKGAMDPVYFLHNMDFQNFDRGTGVIFGNSTLEAVNFMYP